MNVVLYILLIIVSIPIIWVVSVFAYTIFRIASGKMAKKEYENNLRIYDRMKRERNAKKCNSKSSNSGPTDIMDLAQGKDSWF